VSTAAATRIFGLAGWSGSGKTTLLTRLLPELIGHGLMVSTLKHAHHEFDIDQPGKDSWRHRQAGASEVMIASANRWALIREHRGAPEPAFATLLRHMAPADLLLVEGFKREPHAKLEVYRAALGKPLLCRADRHIVAVASDAPVPGLDLPLLALDDVAAIARFILDHFDIKARSHGSAER
jgi:molybdopterin-guanine dinucleotide biosynthesis protein B